MKESEFNPQGTEAAGQPGAELDRRGFLQRCLPLTLTTLTLLEAGQPGNGKVAEGKTPETPGYKAADHNYAMGVDPARCIGCGRCAEACKTENNVPREPFYFRT
jgi:NAD-dependent dihydropyrimidine dehydrogenase PreA subunit